MHVREVTPVASLFAGETATTTTAVADLWGRVELDEGSEFYHGCPRRTNNTAELCGVIQALLWLIYGPAAENGDTAVLLCDSCYAMDSAEGYITPQRNLAAIMVTQDLLAWARTHRDVHYLRAREGALSRRRE